MVTDSSTPGFRSHLRATTSASAIPYGYTITIWSSGTVSADVIGHPHLAEILLFMAGAVLGFVVVSLGAYGTLGPVTREPVSAALPAWAFAHWISAGASIVAVWAADHAIASTAGWTVAGFLATSAYLVLNAAQATLAVRERPVRTRR